MIFLTFLFKYILNPFFFPILPALFVWSLAKFKMEAQLELNPSGEYSPRPKSREFFFRDLSFSLLAHQLWSFTFAISEITNIEKESFMLFAVWNFFLFIYITFSVIGSKTPGNPDHYYVLLILSIPIILLNYVFLLVIL